MPGEEEISPDVLAVLRANTRAITENTEELARVRSVFEKILAAGPTQRVEPVSRGAVPGTVPGAQLISASAEFLRALNAGGKKKKRRDE